MSMKQAVFIKSYRSSEPDGVTSEPESSSLEDSQIRTWTVERLCRPLSHVTVSDSQTSGDQRIQASDRDEEDDLETLLDTYESVPPYDGTGKRTYERACAKVGVTPAARLLRTLGKSEVLDLQYYGFGPHSVIPVAMALMINRCVTEVNLRGNSLGASGMAYVQAMMEDNSSIVHINVAANDLRSEGAVYVAGMLSTNRTIRVLDMSENGFVDADAACLTKAIENHPKLAVVNLSHNTFSDNSSSHFAHMIAENGVLEDLNLSWNHFRASDAQTLGEGISENESLKLLDLSWNGLGDEGASALGKALSLNTTLQHIDLSCTRMSSRGLLGLLTALCSNESLKTIRVGRNNISNAGAKLAMELLKSTSNLALMLLDLSDVILTSHLIGPLLEELRHVHPELQVAHGYTDSYGKRRMRSYDAVAEALGSMQTFCQDNNIQLVDMFARLDADGSKSISRDELHEGLKEAKIPLTSQHVDKLMEALDTDGDKEIDFSELAIGAKQKSERRVKQF